MKKTPRPDGGYTLHNKKGLAGSIGPGVKPPRVRRPASHKAAEETPVEVTPLETSANAFEIRDEAKGTDAPALSVALPDGNRLYAVHPKYAQEIMNDPEKALAEGKAYPSITTVGKIVDQPYLKDWATSVTAREGVKYLREVSRQLDEGNVNEAQKMLEGWLEPNHHGGTVAENAIRKASTNAADRAAERGTNVHAILEELARGENPDVPAEYVGYVRAYEQFRARFPEMEMVQTEVTVINDEHGYAGTADGIVKINGKYYVIDYKTNKSGSIKDDVGLQLSAVANATHIIHPDGSRTPMEKISGGIGVGLGPNGKLTVVPFKTDDYFNDFSNSLQLWYSRRRSRNIAKKGQVNASSVEDILDNI